MNRHKFVIIFIFLNLINITISKKMKDMDYYGEIPQTLQNMIKNIKEKIILDRSKGDLVESFDNDESGWSGARILWKKNGRSIDPLAGITLG